MAIYWQRLGDEEKAWAYYRWVLDRGQPRYARDGLFLGFVGTCIDIDERKRAENELARSLERERRLRTATEEASRLKDGFLAAVLQDLQSPVQAIATWAGHLRQQVPGSSEAAQALDAIEHNARAQERIISSLLDLARVAGGKPPLPRAPVTEPLLTGVRVLIVDDDPAARETMAKVLGIAGAETRAARGIEEALDTLGAFRPDVMLSDVAVRGDGLALIRAVRALPAERGGCLRAAALTERQADDGGAGCAARDRGASRAARQRVKNSLVGQKVQPARGLQLPVRARRGGAPSVRMGNAAADIGARLLQGFGRWLRATEKE